MKRFIRWLLPDVIVGMIIFATGNLLGLDMLAWQMWVFVFVTLIVAKAEDNILSEYRS